MLRRGATDDKASQVEVGFALGASLLGQSLYSTERGDSFITLYLPLGGVKKRKQNTKMNNFNAIPSWSHMHHPIMRQSAPAVTAVLVAQAVQK